MSHGSTSSVPSGSTSIGYGFTLVYISIAADRMMPIVASSQSRFLPPSAQFSRYFDSSSTTSAIIIPTSTSCGVCAPSQLRANAVSSVSSTHGSIHHLLYFFRYTAMLP